MDTSHSITYIRDYPTHVSFFKKILQTHSPLISSEPTSHKNPSPRTEAQDFLVTHYDCEENEQKTLHKYAKNQVTQCQSEKQEIGTPNIVATL